MKIGIDPGLKGAIACISLGGYINVFDMPVIPKVHGKGRQVHAWELARILRENPPHMVCIEAQWARPGQGATSNNSVAFGFGIVLGVIGALGYSHRVIAPVTWKRRAGLWKKPKEAAITVASQLYPEFEQYRDAKNAVDRAEALLIAHYGDRAT